MPESRIERAGQSLYKELSEEEKKSIIKID